MKKKQEITAWLKAYQHEIVSGKLIVFFADECHLLWGDICGYVWGRTDQRISVPVVNERIRQTYFGAVNFFTQESVVKAFDKADSDSSVAWLSYLLDSHQGSRIAIIWDGASYHRSQKVRAYLDSLNRGLDESQWLITCIHFAPNAPEQNPVEDIWLQAKRFIREFYHLCKSFASIKRLFELVTDRQIFHFPKLFMYGSFS